MFFRNTGSATLLGIACLCSPAHANADTPENPPLPPGVSIEPTTPSPSPSSTPTPANPGAPSAGYPPDPFADQYVVPKEHEVGATAGQFRAIATGMVGIGRSGIDLGGKGTLELMTFANLGVRGSLQATAFTPTGQPYALVAKTGPSLHLLPYHRVDLTLFFEAGIGAIDPFESTHAWAPILSPGGALDIWLDSAWFLHGELAIDWGIYADANSSAHAYLHGGASGGLGFAL